MQCSKCFSAQMRTCACGCNLSICPNCSFLIEVPALPIHVGEVAEIPLQELRCPTCYAPQQTQCWCGCGMLRCQACASRSANEVSHVSTALQTFRAPTRRARSRRQAAPVSSPVTAPPRQGDAHTLDALDVAGAWPSLPTTPLLGMPITVPSGAWEGSEPPLSLAMAAFEAM